MSFIIDHIMKSSTEFDNLFTLIKHSKKIEDSYTPYIWELDRPLFFKGCDYGKVWPLSINSYLKICSESELSVLLNKQNFLRINMYYNEDCTKSYISVMNLDFVSLVDEKYKELLLSCNKSMIPCEINMGPIWHFTGINRMMLRSRHIDLGFSLIDIKTHKLYPILGIELLGRDAYPTETTEDQIKEMEEREKIFIIRQ